MSWADQAGQSAVKQGPVTVFQPDFVMHLPEHLQSALEGSNAAAVQISKSAAIRAFRAVDSPSSTASPSYITLKWLSLTSPS